ncbi:MAG: NACHT domain-containing protein [Deltaproteobacteria bacterium]|nr:NACHT domain-containing protein [Deltaproteobacteria bacterium]
MTRYRDAVTAALRHPLVGQPGVFLLIVPSREHKEIGAEVARVLPTERISPLVPGAAAADDKQPWIILGLPRDSATRKTALQELNGRRDRLAAANRQLVLLVTRAELKDVQRYAGDLYSRVRFNAVIPFEPDPTVGVAEARSQLGEWYHRRYGKLDLRGLVRDSTEDIGWGIESIYQELRAMPADLSGEFDARFDRGGRLRMSFELGVGVPLVRLVAAPDHVVVVLAHPGSGKTFFLRWLALRAAREPTLGMSTPLPLLFPLAAFGGAASVDEIVAIMVDTLLEDCAPAAHVLGAALRNGDALLLLDGLDEVGEEALRVQVAARVVEFHSRYPSCRLVVTSRLAGYPEAPLPFPACTIAPLDRNAIKAFLVQWCELYAVDLHGETARDRGRQDGARLAQDVLGNPQLTELAGNPLLLTVLAIVHRTGVRLPDHRVELYSHATRVLVERWNRARSLGGDTHARPLTSADAARLLGPLALRAVRRASRGTVPEAELRESLERELSDRAIKGLASVDEAIDLFKRALGLLVEVAPGLYGFMHLTLAEYLAAWELVRTGELEKLVDRPTEAFLPEWRETLLLALGELGVNRGEDARLAAAIRALLRSARRRRGRPSVGVPSLLAGLLADDPGLTLTVAQNIADELIPRWWFKRDYGEKRLGDFLAEALNLASRIGAGRYASLVVERLEKHINTLPAHMQVPQNAERVLRVLLVCGAGPPAVMALLARLPNGLFVWWRGDGEEFTLSPTISTLVREGAVRLEAHREDKTTTSVEFLGMTGDRGRFRTEGRLVYARIAEVPGKRG